MTEVSLYPMPEARQWIMDNTCNSHAGASLLDLAEDGFVSWETVARAFLYDADRTACHNALVRVAEWSV